MKDSLKMDIWKLIWVLLGWTINAWIYVKLGIVQYTIILGIGIFLGKIFYDIPTEWSECIEPLLVPFSLVPSAISELMNRFVMWRCNRVGYRCEANFLGIVAVLVRTNDFEEFANNIEKIRSEVAHKFKWPKFLVRVYWR